MKYAFFPGCVLKGVASEAFMATKKVNAILAKASYEYKGTAEVTHL